MSDKIIFPVELRAQTGKKVASLRAAGQIPGNIMGKLDKPVAIVFTAKSFGKMYEQAGDSGLIYLQAGKDEYPVLVDDVQLDPITDLVVHVVFRNVDLKQVVEAEVSVELIGEVTIPDVVVVQVKDTVDVEALPVNLPDHFELDLSTLTEIGQSLTYRDLKFDASKVTLKIEEDQMDEPLVILQAQREEVEEAPVVEETPAEGTPDAAAGETPAAPADKE